LTTVLEPFLAHVGLDLGLATAAGREPTRRIASEAARTVGNRVFLSRL